MVRFGRIDALLRMPETGRNRRNLTFHYGFGERRLTTPKSAGAEVKIFAPCADLNEMNLLHGAKNSCKMVATAALRNGLAGTRMNVCFGRTPSIPWRRCTPAIRLVPAVRPIAAIRPIATSLVEYQAFDLNH
jgi:hypothetical protein